MRSDRYDNPAADPEAEPFLKSVAASPGDQLPRLVFADWLEENGYHNAAHGQRWAAKYNKSPGEPRYTSGERNLEPGGWWLGGTHNTHTGERPEYLSMQSPFAARTLPMHFFQAEPGGLWQTSRLFNSTAGGHDPVKHEAAFVDATHRVKWDESGEPVNPYSLDE